MSTLNERAEGLKEWAIEGAPPDEVAAALVKADAAALRWEVAQRILPAEQVKQIEAMLAHMIANGYEPPAR